MKSIGCVVASPGIAHVSRHAIENIERAAARGGWQLHSSPAAHRVAGRLLHHLGRLGGIRALRRSGRHAVLVPMMGLWERALFPLTYCAEIVPIIFDCMPNDFPVWKALFERNRISLGFFTARTAAQHFARALPQGEWLWLPEAIELAQFDAAASWSDRRIDVLEFGRRLDSYHDALRPGLMRAGRRHAYERTKGDLVFATRDAFIRGLSQTRIAICFPQSQTHPERFGEVETLTQRYLESMASGCLVLGRAPQELVSLFGYDPVIPVDWDAPLGQVEALLRSPEDHAGLRLRNLASVRTRGHWDNRMRELADALAIRGYWAAR